MNTVSVPHRQMHFFTKNSANQRVKATTKIFNKLCRILHNRNSYCFQLLKQFILFSSDEESIIVPYKYSRFELEHGTDYLENVYGLNVKLTLGKAFHDIKSCSEKKKVYQNNIHILRFIKAYEKAIKVKRQSLLNDAFRLLTQFV
jgi:hypothetical protein